MGKSSYFYLSIGQKTYFYMSIGNMYYFYILQYVAIKINVYVFYLRGNRARINFYVLLVYLYREKKKAAKNGLYACYIELCIKKIKIPRHN